MKLTQAEKWEAIEAKLPKVERAATAARYDTHRKRSCSHYNPERSLRFPLRRYAH